MSLPQRTPSRKPRRLGLWAPFALALAGALGVCATWFWLRSNVEREMESSRAALVTAGWTLDWDRRAITGFPFRLDVSLDNLRVHEPSGWGLAARRLKAEAFVFAPAHWVVVAPAGVLVTRRRGGPLAIAAKVLRASVSDAGQSPPRISVEGLGLTFRTAPGASPFPLLSATEFHLHFKSGPADQAAAYLGIDGAVTRPDTVVGRVSNGGPATLVVDAIYTNAKALRGRSLPIAIRRWGMAGGHLHLRRLRLAGGTAEISARTGQFGVSADGRLVGEMVLTVKQASKVLGALSAQGLVAPDAARSAAMVAGSAPSGAAFSYLPLSFQAGRTTLGPIAVGPAPRLY